MSVPADYRQWWAAREDAGHAHKTEEWFEKNAYELMCLFPAGGTLLDVGCGNAQLLSYLAKHFDVAVGIDCSAKMLEGAARRIRDLGLKNVRLELGDACRFPQSIPAPEVILSTQVLQYLQPHEVRLHLAQCRGVLGESGVVGLCETPWSRLWEAYHARILEDGPLRPAVKRMLAWARRRLMCWKARRRGPTLRDHIGFWYGRNEVQELAAAEGFQSETLSCWHYRSRFHARLWQSEEGKRRLTGCRPPAGGHT